MAGGEKKKKKKKKTKMKKKKQKKKMEEKTKRIRRRTTKEEERAKQEERSEENKVPICVPGKFSVASNVIFARKEGITISRATSRHANIVPRGGTEIKWGALPLR